VAIGGDGGDELFGGYDPFRALRLAEIYQKFVPKPIHRAIRIAVSLLPTSHRNLSLDFKIKRTLRGLAYPRWLWNPVWLGPLDPRDLEELFSSFICLEEVYEEAIKSWESCAQTDLADKTLQFYTDLYLQDNILVKVDRASMLNSLEVRAPFLDLELVDFVRRIPCQYKIRNGCTKYILKKALKPILPGEILYRPKKGFGVPVGKWFQEGSLTLDGGARIPMLNPAFVSRQLSEHRAGRIDHRSFLWSQWLLTHFQS
jgi:asparagine synthase (glutamine-hydrolysing)